MKKCCECKIEKQDDQFYKNKTNKDGLQNKCKDCEKKYKKQYYIDNKETIDNDQKDYRKNNKEKTLISRKKSYKKHKEKTLKSCKQYRKNNKEKVSNSSKKHYRKNKIHIQKARNIRFKKRIKTDPAFRLRKIVSVHIGTILKSNNSSKNNKSILNFLPYTMQELKVHLEKQFESWMNWDNYGIYNAKTWDHNNQSTWTWNIDHIIPQSTLPYVSMNDENFKKCWALENLRSYSAKQNFIDGVTRIRHKEAA